MLQAELRQCRECRRLFSGLAKQDVCPECMRIDVDNAEAVDRAVDRFGCQTIDEIVENTGLPPADVERIVRNTPILRERIATQFPCERCKDRFATSESRYCLECRLDLNRAFAQATLELIEKITRLAENRTHQPVGYRHMSVAQALRVKRALTGMNRFDPTPRRAK